MSTPRRPAHHGGVPYCTGVRYAPLVTCHSVRYAPPPCWPARLCQIWRGRTVLKCSTVRPSQFRCSTVRPPPLLAWPKRQGGVLHGNVTPAAPPSCTPQLRAQAAPPLSCIPELLPPRCIPQLHPSAEPPSCTPWSTKLHAPHPNCKSTTGGGSWGSKFPNSAFSTTGGGVWG